MPLAKLKELFFNIFFPKFCLNCRKEGSYICKECEIFISENFLICPICKKPSFFGETHKECKRRYGIDGLVSIWDYDGIIKMGICSAKDSGIFDVITELTERAFYALSLEQNRRFKYFLSFLLIEDFHIFYVPIKSKKEKERGFNQSEIIAKKFGKIFNKTPLPFLKKRADLSEWRKDNFYVVKEDLKEFKKAVLIDDFLFSGETIKECARVLKKAGIEEIWGFTLGRAV